MDMNFHPQRKSIVDRKGDWIITYTGVEFWPLDPRVEDVNIEDISVSLSRLARFTGHTIFTYTVAQHSIYVSEVLFERYKCPKLALKGLLHDATEAYTNDINRPLKKLDVFSFFRDIEKHLQNVIYKKFELYSIARDELDNKLIHQVDMEVFNAEVDQLIKHKHKMTNSHGGFNKADIKIDKMHEEDVLALFVGMFKIYGSLAENLMHSPFKR